MVDYMNWRAAIVQKMNSTFTSSPLHKKESAINSNESSAFCNLLYITLYSVQNQTSVVILRQKRKQTLLEAVIFHQIDNLFAILAVFLL